MAHLWLYSMFSVIIVSLISLVGIITLVIKGLNSKRTLLFLVSFAAGALFGDSFIHLLPEVVEKYGFGLNVSLYFLLGIVIFFVLEKLIHWRHCHVPTTNQHPHPLAFMNLVGDGLHNFIDGLLIAGSYISSIPLGIATTIAVILHEIPQELGDFGVLLHAGLSKIKALFFNFISALLAVIGVIAALIMGSNIENLSLFILPLTAGGFIYIAGSDLIPELHKTCEPPKESIFQLIAFVLGIVIMLLLVLLE